MSKKFPETYKNKMRVRACGICITGSKIVLVRHEGLGETGTFWSPPGGGTHYAESVTTALSREFEEETGLTVHVKEFLFVHEFIGRNLHALEFFFRVLPVGGRLTLGSDPEHSRKNQILKEVKVFSEAELRDIPPDQRHQIFNLTTRFHRLIQLNGFFKSENNSIK